MSDVVNLNRFRKKRRTEADEARAAENRVKFGRSKAQKKLGSRERERGERTLDERRLNRPDDEDRG